MSIIILFFFKNLLSFSLHIVHVLLWLSVYKRPSDLEARSGKGQYKYYTKMATSVLY